MLLQHQFPVSADPDATAVDLWPVCRLSALFAKDADAGNALARASAALGAAVPPHTIAAIANDDWVRQTQQQFQPICVAPKLWIVPSWCEPVDANAINLRLDPGLAFGTGSHPTTRMCLRWLALHLSGGETVLDYGCGSGILSIAAAKLGAGAVDGIDVDRELGREVPLGRVGGLLAEGLREALDRDGFEQVKIVRGTEERTVSVGGTTDASGEA